MEEIILKGDSCWNCGNYFDPEKHKETGHHAIPINLHPKRNIKVPICWDCHKKINKQDINSLVSFGYKISREFLACSMKLQVFNNLLEDLKKTLSRKSTKIKRRVK